MEKPNNIQVGDVVEWDMVTRVNQFTHKRIAEHGPGPFIVTGLSHGMVLLDSKDPDNGVWPWRFKVNHFLTAVRKAKLNAAR